MCILPNVKKHEKTFALNVDIFNFDIKYALDVAKIRSKEYYVNMMKAWYIATALAKQYDAVLPILKERLMDSWSHNKAIQKARESYRITPQQKEYLSTLKV